MWNRMEIPIQEKREECFRNQNSLLPVFLLQHKHHVHTSLPSPRKRRDPEFWPFDGQAWWKDTCCYSLGDWLWSLPVDCALLTTRSMYGWSSDGAVAITKHHSLSCSGILFGALSPSHHWLISEGRDKNAACPTCVVHIQSLTHFYQNEAILFKWRVRGRQSYVLVQRKRECCIFFLTSWVSGLLFPCSLRVSAYPHRLESAGTHCLLCSLGPAMKRSVWGEGFPPLI